MTSLLILVIGMVCAVRCGDPVSRVTVGMTEEQVRTVLGTPSRTVTDRRDIEFYLGKDNRCAGPAKRVILYDRWLREDVTVALGEDAKVVCVETMVLLTH